jgi:hypothetical protein
VPRDYKIRGHTVGQSPNPPLWVALAALLLSLLADGGPVDDSASAVFYVALTIWAYGEASSGVNRFRKLVGAVALALIAVSLARRFA